MGPVKLLSGKPGITLAHKAHSLHYLHIKPLTMGNKQDEVELLVGKYVMKIWWDDSHDCNIAIEGYNLFKRNKKNRKQEGALHANIQTCSEIQGNE